MREQVGEWVREWVSGGAWTTKRGRCGGGGDEPGSSVTEPERDGDVSLGSLPMVHVASLDFSSNTTVPTLVLKLALDVCAGSGMRTQTSSTCHIR